MRGIRLGKDQQVIALIVLGEGDILTATANGFGKRTEVSEYPRKGRGTRGVISIQTTERNGEVVGALLVQSSDERLGKDQSYLLDSTSMRQVHGWSDQITLGQGLQETLGWVNANLDTLKTLPWSYQHKT